jgi:glycosyltransferase involved in cell wall biosynthesis
MSEKKLDLGGPIRVARVIARLNVGGPAIHVTLLAGRLPREKFESRLYVGDVSPGEAEMTDIIAREKVEPIRIKGLGRAIRPHDDLMTLARLVREFRRFRPHIVHTHTAKGGTLGRLAARICGVPIVVHTFHGHVFHGYFHPAVSRGFVGIERALAHLTNAIVTISPRQFDEISKKYRIAPPDRVRVIPLGFDLARFRGIEARRGELRKSLGVPEATRIISIVGRLTGVKDHALLFRAMQLLKHPGVHLCVVGGGELEPDLRRLSVDLGLESKVHFLGFRNDLERILADTEIIALSSKNEGTPVAVIEALAAGCTPVSVDVGGVADVLAEGRFGKMVKERSREAFAAALDEVLASPPDPKVREAGQRYVLERYGVERLVRDHVELYCALLRGRESA